jgi:hypothetical protein
MKQTDKLASYSHVNNITYFIYDRRLTRDINESDLDGNTNEVNIIIS